MHPTAESLANSFDFNTHLVRLQAQGLTHAESLVQPPFRGNCLNWVVGHMLSGRDTCLRLLRQPVLFTAPELEIYDRGSPPLTDPARALPLEDLLSRLGEAGQRLRAALESLSEIDLGSEVPISGGPRPLGEMLAFLQWHETYHLGQLELLRQLAGKDDQVL